MDAEQMLRGLGSLRKRRDDMRKRLEKMQAELETLDAAIDAHSDEVGEAIRHNGLLAFVDDAHDGAGGQAE